MNNPVLVTGAMGCLGAWTLYHLVRQGRPVVAFDLSTDRYRVNDLLTAEEQTAVTFIQGDLTDLLQVKDAFSRYGIAHVIHLGALQVPFCRANPTLGAQVNVTGTVNVFEAAREHGLKHVAFASSVAVYGPGSDYPPGPLKQDAPVAPRTLYGVYKVANEGTARVYWQDHGMSSIWLRPYTIYGVGRDQGLTSDPTKAMRAAVRGESFEIGFGGAMQLQLASDVALQFIDAALHPLPGANGFNLGTPAATIDEVIEIIRLIRPDAKITRTDARLPFPESFDDSALRGAVETVYETPLSEGIQQTMAHFERLQANAS